MEGSKGYGRACIAALFAVYVLTVLGLTVFRPDVHYSDRQLNPTLFIDLIKIYRHGRADLFFRLFLGNIAWFIPFGFLLPLLLRNIGPFLTTLCGFLFSFAIELSQFTFHKGVAELDDLILNTLGTLAGYLLLRLFQRHRQP